MRLLIAFALISQFTACSPNEPPMQTEEQYAKSPDGCEAFPAEWYGDEGKTPEGQKRLRRLLKTYEMRSDYHGRQAKFISIGETEKREHVHRAITCLREAQWAAETLAKAGVSLKDVKQ